MVMSETGKPFVCSKKGCNMAFTNEDHLTVHQKKHDMNLQLGIEGQNSVIADQTPTPTRFIRNCEEVGLFQDLQNVNPFDETFQKATEMAKSGALHVPETPADDSLHTPHILPHIEANNSIKYVRNISNEPEFTVTTIDESLLNEEPDNEVEVLSLYDSDSDTSMVLVTECDPVISSHGVTRTKKSREEPPIQVEEQIQLSGEFVEVLTKENQDEEVKVKLKHAIKRKMQRDGADLHKREVIFIYEPAENLTSLATRPSNKSINNNDSPSKDTTSHTINNMLERKREVNRAAQFRSRLKKKSWIKQMEGEVNRLREENRDIKNENRVLKNEIIWLKAILLYHKDCPVAKDPRKMQEITEIAKMAQEDQDQMDRLRNKKPKPTLPNLAPAVTSVPVNRAVNSVVNPATPVAPVTSVINPATPVIPSIINSVAPVINPVNSAANPILISVPPTYSTSASFVQTPLWNPGQFCSILPKPKNAYQPPIFPKAQSNRQTIVIQPSQAPVAVLQNSVISSKRNLAVRSVNASVPSSNFKNVLKSAVESSVDQLIRLNKSTEGKQAGINLSSDSISVSTAQQKTLKKPRKPRRLHLKIETPEVSVSETKKNELGVLDLSTSSRLKRERKQKLQVRIEPTIS